MQIIEQRKYLKNLFQELLNIQYSNPFHNFIPNMFTKYMTNQSLQVCSKNTCFPYQLCERFRIFLA